MLGRTNAMNRGKAEGLYVWTRHYYTPEETITNPTFVGVEPILNSAYDRIKIEDESFDITRISDFKTFFNGFNSTDGRMLYIENDVLKWYKPRVAQTISTFNTSLKLLLTKTTTTTLKEERYTYVFSGTKTLKPVIGNIKDYVIDDDPSAYPNGGTKDGYYYELLASAPSTNAMSLSDNALAVVQQDYRNQIITEVNT